MTVFVDTNILLDVLLKRDPDFESARRLWDQIERRAIDGYISAISFNNVYYILRKQAGHSIGMNAVSLLRQIFQIVPLDDRIIEQAISQRDSDLEDAIQAASAARAKAEYLISRNSKDFAFSPIPVISATEFLAITQNR